MRYQIILDAGVLQEFAQMLPVTTADESFYLTLLARKKYGSSQYPCARVAVRNREELVSSIEKMQVADHLYKNKQGKIIEIDALALYISMNPRSHQKAQRTLAKKLVDNLCRPTELTALQINPTSLAMSELQKSISRNCYVDFDFDVTTEQRPFCADILNKINGTAVIIVQTRGGYHVLVEPSKVSTHFANSWYQSLSTMEGCDVVRDMLLPVPGCTQGGYMPQVIYTNVR